MSYAYNGYAPPDSRTEGATSDHEDKKEKENENTTSEKICGREPCLHVVVFVAIFGTLLLLNSTAEHYFTYIMTVVESRYQFRKMDLNFMVGMSKVGFVLTVVLAAYFSTVGHKPRVIFAGGIITALGNLICALPYFIYGSDYEAPDRLGYHKAGICLTNSNLTVEFTRQCNAFDEDKRKGDVFSCLCAGQFLAGIGIGLFATIGLSYITENAKRRKVPLFLGICLCLNSLGQTLGVLLGHLFSTVPENLSNDGEEDKPQSIGAWWLGFTIFLALFILISLPFLLFPRWFQKPQWLVRVHARYLKKKREKEKKLREYLEKKRRQKEKKNKRTGQTNSGAVNHGMDNSDGISSHANSSSPDKRYRQNEGNQNNDRYQKKQKEHLPMPRRHIEDMPRKIGELLCDTVFLALMFGASCGAFLQGGYAFVLHHYISVQFDVSTESAILAVAIVSGLLSAVGVMIGGAIISKFDFKSKESALMILIILGVTTLGVLIQMAFSCDINTASKLPDYNSDCTEKCDCTEERVQINPICGSDGVTYLGPCHAGCSHLSYETSEGSIVNTGDFNFTDCPCIGDGSYASLGACDNRCPHLYGFMALFAIIVLVHGVAQVPIVHMSYRCVEERNMGLSLGFLVWAVYLIAYVIGPVIYDAVKDACCNLWRPNCHGEDICFEFDTEKYRILLHCVVVIFQVLSIICFFFIWLVKRKQQKDKEKAAMQSGDADDTETHDNDAMETHENYAMETRDEQNIEDYNNFREGSNNEHMYTRARQESVGEQYQSRRHYRSGSESDSQQEHVPSRYPAEREYGNELHAGYGIPNGSDNQSDSRYHTSVSGSQGHESEGHQDQGHHHKHKKHKHHKDKGHHKSHKHDEGHGHRHGEGHGHNEGHHHHHERHRHHRMDPDPQEFSYINSAGGASVFEVNRQPNYHY